MASILHRHNSSVNVFSERIILRKGRPIGLPFLFFILLAGASLFSPQNVHATGGAYTSVKHGGGTTDGVAPFGGGVQRGVNPAYAPGGQYYPANPNAGLYQAGECAHCHEPHASFGGTEPPPNAPSDTAGPTAYLVMKGDYNSATQGANSNLCWYCHESMTLNAKPLGHGWWDFYWGQTYYQAAGHNTNLNFKWPGTTGDPITTWPRQNRSLLPSGNTGSCVNCHTPHGLKGTSLSQFDTTAVPVAKQTVASGNPDVNADYLTPRQLIAWEEALCENCHKAGVGQPYTDAKAIKEQLDCLNVSATTPCGGTGGSTTQGSGHPVHNVDQAGGTVTTFSGRHSLNKEGAPTSGSWNAYSSVPASRHVECVDCHNPHVVQNATVFQQSGVPANPNRISDAGGVKAGGANKGVWGIQVNTTTGATTPLVRKDDANLSSVNYSSLYLYEICLKCHSAAADTTLTSNAAPSWTNSARWPNTGAASFDFWAVAMNLSDVAVDFSMDTAPIVGTLLKGYHPVLGVGRNTPPVTANCRWGRTRLDATCTPVTGGNESANRPTGVRNTTIDFGNNFVPPWGPNSLVTCVDCHESDNEAGALLMAQLSRLS